MKKLAIIFVTLLISISLLLSTNSVFAAPLSSTDTFTKIYFYNADNTTMPDAAIIEAAAAPNFSLLAANQKIAASGVVGSTVAIAAAAAEIETYDNLYASVQGETNANAAYMAFAAKANDEGYPVIARLFVATAEAEAKHAADEWAILVGMGATERPVAAAPTVGATADNLQAAIAGETYETTVMYPGFLDTALAEGETAAAGIFRLAGRAEAIHAANFTDALANLDDPGYLSSTYGVVYRCPVCGEVVTDIPARCPTCGAGGSLFIAYYQTYIDLYAAVQGETNANAAYLAFAAKADEEGYPVIARLFVATAEAEAKHAADEWDILLGMGAVDKPIAAVPNVGATADNLQTAIAGETYETTVMYPGFLDTANEDGFADAARIFRMAGRAEAVHAANFTDALANLNDPGYLSSTYGVVYRCPVCGEVVNEIPVNCPICGAGGLSFIAYYQTYFNLYASVQGETNANAAYLAFAQAAKAEGYHEVSRLFVATAEAEAKHAADEWAILQRMGAVDKPVAAVPNVGTTAENLQAAIAGETYETTIMYPGFLDTANDDGLAEAARIFRLAGRAEAVHAANYTDVLANLGNAGYLAETYGVVYRCPVCGEVVTEIPTSCPICGANGSSFIAYAAPQINLAASVTKLNGNMNSLSITITETYADGTVNKITKAFMIANNSAGVYVIDGYKIYVDTKGNTQIRQLYII